MTNMLCLRHPIVDQLRTRRIMTISNINQKLK